jgi:RNase H-fold protein (predicted Holliday junction resolvase)
VSANEVFLGFDPGRDKCGVAVVDRQGRIYEHRVVLAQESVTYLGLLLERYAIARLIMGNQTTSKSWQNKLEAVLPKEISIVLVDERNSSLEARDRYWQMYPPQGLKKLIPQGMRLPPVPIDDIVAILLIERYLAGLI